jgi:hypothetical protein
MKIHLRLVLLLLAATPLLRPQAQAQAQAQSQTKDPASSQPAGTNALRTATSGASTNRPAAPKFRPVTKPAPSVRLTGGSRGTGEQLVSLDVLAPADVGFTTREQPSLFWFQSRPSKARLELAILQENRAEPVFSRSFDQAANAGIQRLDLKGTDVKLVPGTEYQWVVALVTDPDNRSTDLVASGFIKRVEAGADTPPGAGFWYDTVAALSDRIEAQPADAALRGSRADLLRNAGLTTAAAFDTAARP